MLNTEIQSLTYYCPNLLRYFKPFSSYQGTKRCCQATWCGTPTPTSSLQALNTVDCEEKARNGVPTLWLLMLLRIRWKLNCEQYFFMSQGSQLPTVCELLHFTLLSNRCYGPRICIYLSSDTHYCDWTVQRETEDSRSPFNVRNFAVMEWKSSPVQKKPRYKVPGSRTALDTKLKNNGIFNNLEFITHSMLAQFLDFNLTPCCILA
jgi:hypothetical protein